MFEVVVPPTAEPLSVQQVRVHLRQSADYDSPGAGDSPGVPFETVLDADGKPRADLFAADALHLNPAGYAVWQSVISSHLVPSAAPPVAVAGP